MKVKKEKARALADSIKLDSTGVKKLSLENVSKELKPLDEPIK